MTRPPDHYFASDPDSPSRPRTVTLALPDLAVDLATDRGVFSADRVDPGTRILLSEVPPITPPASVVLDLGCGYGPIAIAAARRAPDATVWAVDVNRRARELCAQNAADAGCSRVVTAQPDAVPADVTFDVIWSNPPIRIGKPALHELLTRWLDRLTPGSGRAWLVVQKHLGSDSLAEWMRSQGWAVERRASRQAYRILEVAARAQPDFD